MFNFEKLSIFFVTLHSETTFEEAIDEILGNYGDFEDANLPDDEEVKVARLMDVEDFLYTTVTIYRPLRLFYTEIAQKAAEADTTSALQSLISEAR